MDRFFSYCPECQFGTHATAEEAAKAAEEHLEHYQDDAGDGWSDDVTGICWGEIKATCDETSRRPYDPTQDFGVDPDCSEIVEYAIVPFTEDSVLRDESEYGAGDCVPTER